MRKSLLLLMIIPAIAGCAVALGVAGAGGALGYRYVKGELKVTYNYSFEKVWDATQKALKDLELKVISKRWDMVEGIIEARTGLGKKVKIKAKSKGKTTTLSIRVGTLGDVDYSLAIKYRIDAYLKGEADRWKRRQDS